MQGHTPFDPRCLECVRGKSTFHHRRRKDDVAECELQADFAYLSSKSFFRVLHRVASLRADAAWARTWLTNITSKKLLTLGLAADRADSLMQLTRFLDAESVDPSLLNQEIGNFLRAGP